MGRWLAVDTNNVPSFSVMLSMIDSAQLLTYDNVTAPGSFSDMVSRRHNRSRVLSRFVAMAVHGVVSTQSLTVACVGAGHDGNL